MVLLETDLVQFTLNVLQFIIPAVIVFLVAYYVLHRFLEEDYRKKLLDYREANGKLLVPAKLQAYERLTIFLERMSPDNLVMRLANSNDTATVFRQKLIESIQEEYNHNVSQQIYISDQAWKLIKGVKEQLIRQIDNAYKDMHEGSRATDLGKQILQDLMYKKDQPTEIAISFLKKEIALLL